jgi:hypothetical protein
LEERTVEEVVAFIRSSYYCSSAAKLPCNHPLFVISGNVSLESFSLRFFFVIFFFCRRYAMLTVSE